MYKIRVTADDFGATTSINNAVEILHRNGVLNYAAIMVQGSEFKQALKIIKRNKDLKIGLHFTMSDEKSITKPKSITKENGFFFSRKKLLIKSLLNNIKANEVLNELKSQIAILEKNGINIEFINGHQHIHTYPIIRDVIIQYTKENNLYLRSINQKYMIDKNFFENIKNLVKYLFYKIYNKKVIKKNLKTNNLLVSSFNNSDLDFTIKGIQKSFNSIKYSHLKNGDLIEFMAHPASSMDDLKKYWYKEGMNLKDRIDEFETLKSNKFIELCKRYNCDII